MGERGCARRLGELVKSSQELLSGKQASSRGHGEMVCVLSRLERVAESEALFVVVLPRRGCARHRVTPVFVGNSS